MSSRWSIESLDWSRFDASLVDGNLLAIAKTAALVEARAADYVAYLVNIFAGDAEFVAAARTWGAEERQHGAALTAWARRADPAFDFKSALADFARLYPLPTDATQSIRGSRAGELVARQIVETGTSSFYSAIRDAAREPVLKEIAGRIAQDEYFHYRLFRTHFARHDRAQPLSVWQKLRIAIGRFSEGEDDELGTAWFAANVLPHEPDADYHARDYGRIYWGSALRLYARSHSDNALRMILRALDFRSNGWLFRLFSPLFWRHVQGKARGAA